MKLLFLLTFLLMITQSCLMQKKDNQSMKHTNRLVKETSPYLLQHAHNPVDWYPWGEEAFEKAKKEGKLVLVSIGYSACHWCHVMENESFENEEVAKIMNDNFVCIKVDREERPDVDQIYMEAVQMMTGSGGWPLNCFTLPDKKPVYGGTYFPKNNWIEILNSLSNLYEENPQKVKDQAEKLLAGIKQYNDLLPSEKKVMSENDITSVYNNLSKHFDHSNGGMQGAPKFPIPIVYEYLLAHQFYTGNKQALSHVYLTLDKMEAGGIYDQLGGGFARYSVDEKWFAPHFEKMLYDNAQLIELYSKAYQISGNSQYKKVVEQSIEFVERELMSDEHGFYSALDADSEGEEGKFYVWKTSEIRDVLNERSPLIEKYYGITESGNWEFGNNILIKASSVSKLSKKFDLSENEVEAQIKNANEKLLKVRNKRIRPGLDDKILSSWNGLMLKALVVAYSVFNDEKYLQLAQNNATFIKKELIKNDFRLDRNYKNGKSTINAFLDDYANVIDAYITLYEATFNENWIELATNLMNYAIEHYFDEEQMIFYYTSNLDKNHIVRKTDLNDNVLPSAVGVMASNLKRLYQINSADSYELYFKALLSRMPDRILENPYYHAGWAMLALNSYYPSYEVAIVGKDYDKLRKEFNTKYLPGVVYAGSKEQSEIPLLQNRYVKESTYIYICQDKACKLPVENIVEALKMLDFNPPNR